MIIPDKMPISICRDARSLCPLEIKELTLLIRDTRAECPYILELFPRLGYLCG